MSKCGYCGNYLVYGTVVSKDPVPLTYHIRDDVTEIIWDWAPTGQQNITIGLFHTGDRLVHCHQCRIVRMIPKEAT